MKVERLNHAILLICSIVFILQSIGYFSPAWFIKQRYVDSFINDLKADGRTFKFPQSQIVANEGDGRKLTTSTSPSATKTAPVQEFPSGIIMCRPNVDCPSSEYFSSTVMTTVEMPMHHVQKRSNTDEDPESGPTGGSDNNDNNFIVMKNPTQGEKGETTKKTVNQKPPTTARSKPPATATARTKPPATVTARSKPSATATARTKPPANVTARTKPPATVTARTKPPATATARTKPPATATARTKPPVTVTARTKPPATVTARTKPPATATARTKPPATVTARTKPLATVTARTKPPTTVGPTSMSGNKDSTPDRIPGNHFRGDEKKSDTDTSEIGPQNKNPPVHTQGVRGGHGKYVLSLRAGVWYGQACIFSSRNRSQEHDMDDRIEWCTLYIRTDDDTLGGVMLVPVVHVILEHIRIHGDVMSGQRHTAHHLFDHYSVIVCAVGSILSVLVTMVITIAKCRSNSSPNEKYDVTNVGGNKEFPVELPESCPRSARITVPEVNKVTDDVTGETESGYCEMKDESISDVNTGSDLNSHNNVNDFGQLELVADELKTFEV
ncbi:hypothetical protein ACF0H5_006453 [Mactra antiquata]